MKWQQGTSIEVWYVTTDGEIVAIITKHVGNRYSYKDKSFISQRVARLYVENWYKNIMVMSTIMLKSDKDILSE